MCLRGLKFVWFVDCLNAWVLMGLRYAMCVCVFGVVFVCAAVCVLLCVRWCVCVRVCMCMFVCWFCWYACMFVCLCECVFGSSGYVIVRLLV